MLGLLLVPCGLLLPATPARASSFVYLETFETPAAAAQWEIKTAAAVEDVTLTLVARQRVQGSRSLRVRMPRAAAEAGILLRRRADVDLAGSVEVTVAVKVDKPGGHARLLVETELAGRRRTFTSRPARLVAGWQELCFRLDQPMFEEAAMPGEPLAVWDADRIKSLGLFIGGAGGEVFLDALGARRIQPGRPKRPLIKGPNGKLPAASIVELRRTDSPAPFELHLEHPDGGLERFMSFSLEGTSAVRLRLDTPGAYHAFAMLTGEHGAMSSEPVSLDVVAAERAAPVAQSAGSFAALKTLAGLEIPWAEDYSKHLRALAAGGGNLVRLWLRGDGFFPPWRNGRPDEAVCRRFDNLLAEANALGLAVVLVLFSAEDLMSPYSPWLARNGGPCSVPSDFFTLSAAGEDFAEYVTYCLRRWAAYPNLLAVDVADGFQAFPALSEKAMAEWFSRLRGIFEGMGVRRPLLAFSLEIPAGRTDEVIAASRDALRFAELLLVSSNAAPTLEDLYEWARLEHTLGIPVLASGWRGGWRAADDAADASGRVYRVGLWAGAALTGWAAPLGWWWNSHVPEKRLHSAFADIVLLSSPLAGMKPAEPLLVKKADGHLLAGRVGSRGAILLVAAPAAFDTAGQPAPLGSIKVKVMGLLPGKYETAVLDAMSGKPLGAGSVKVTGAADLQIEAAETCAVVLRLLPAADAVPAPAAALE